MKDRDRLKALNRKDPDMVDQYNYKKLIEYFEQNLNLGGISFDYIPQPIIRKLESEAFFIYNNNEKRTIEVYWDMDNTNSKFDVTTKFKWL